MRHCAGSHMQKILHIIYLKKNSAGHFVLMGMFTVGEKCISVYVLTGDLPFCSGSGKPPGQPSTGHCAGPHHHTTGLVSGLFFASQL